MKYVYELIKDGKVIDVGETIRPKIRLREHTRYKRGKYYGQHDIELKVVAGPIPRPDALALEAELKTKYGFELTEQTRVVKAGSTHKGRKAPWVKGSPSNLTNLQTCIHCGRTMNAGNIAQYHNEKCKHKDSDQQ